MKAPCRGRKRCSWVCASGCASSGRSRPTTRTRTRSDVDMTTMMMTKDANRPPRDITPAVFFRDWLPREFEREFGAGKRAAADITVAIELEGDDGGHWILDVSGGTLSVRQSGQPGPQPMVSLWQS